MSRWASEGRVGRVRENGSEMGRIVSILLRLSPQRSGEAGMLCGDLGRDCYGGPRELH